MEKQRKEFGKIYDKYINKIYRFVFLKVSSEEIAQDLTSETFTKGWQAFQRNTKIDNIQAFLYSIARNLVTDYYRTKGRTQFVSTEDTVIVDNKPGLEEMAKTKSDMEQIKATLVNLNEDYQNIIVWHYIDDLSIPEIAKMMDKTEETARVTLHRALKSLKEKMNVKEV